PSASSSTASVRQCGIAKPPGMPVAKDSSRLSRPASSPSRSARPVAAMRSAIRPITACLSPGGSTSRRTSSEVIRGADMAVLLRTGSSAAAEEGGSEADDAARVDADLVGAGDGGAGEADGGRPVGEGAGEALRRAPPERAGDEIAGRRGVPGADGRDHRSGRGGAVPGAARGGQEPARPAEGHQHGADAAMVQIQGCVADPGELAVGRLLLEERAVGAEDLAELLRI